MQSNFGVSGIPHAVVIDRNGNIQLVKVGSGEANSKAIEGRRRRQRSRCSVDDLAVSLRRKARMSPSGMRAFLLIL
jgi:hypothetical protein